MNPDIDAKSHPHISTGLKINKFGVAVDAARELFASLGRPAVPEAGGGSRAHRIADDEPGAAARRGPLCRRADRGTPARRPASSNTSTSAADWGFPTTAARVVSPGDYVSALVDEVRPTGLPIVVEPGRSIVGPAAALVARVIDIKPRNALERIRRHRRRHDRADAAGALQRVSSDRTGPPAAGTRPRQYEIVGPVCESSDVVGRDRTLPPLEVGDLVAIRDTGAYGSAMASNYNRRPLPAEVMVDEGEWRVIRRRQTVDDMLALETL